MKLLISILLVGIPLFSFAQSAEVREHVKQSQNEIKVTQIMKATQSWDGSPMQPYTSKNPEITGKKPATPEINNKPNMNRKSQHPHNPNPVILKSNKSCQDKHPNLQNAYDLQK
jgi:hypothetical protein